MAYTTRRRPTRAAPRHHPGIRRAALLLLGSGMALGTRAAVLAGPGDPTTPYLDGFGSACRMAFDPDGALLVNDGGVFYRAVPGEAPVLLTDAAPDARGFAVDAFGNILTGSPADSAVLRITPAGAVSRFADVFNARGVAVGPDGGVWVSTGDSIHHLDPVGRPLGSIDLRAAGAAGFGMGFSPAGELHFSNFAGLWKLVDGAVVPVLTEVTPRNRGFTIDGDGNLYWAREAQEGDTDRVILYDAAGEVLNDTIIGEVTDPCLVLFVRDTTGDMTRRMLVGQLDGSIVEANDAGIPAIGWPAPPLAVAELGDTTCADAAAGLDGTLSPVVAGFLDAIGNNNGSYDVGDFRAYLQTTGRLPGGGS